MLWRPNTKMRPASRHDFGANGKAPRLVYLLGRNYTPRPTRFPSRSLRDSLLRLHKLFATNLA